MTIGRNNEAPAAYALTSTIRRLLDHLTEADLFSAKDLESMSHTLDHLSEIVHSSDTESAPLLETLLANRIERCRVSLESLQKKIGDIAEPLRPTAEKLVSMLRQMAVVNTRTKVLDKPLLIPNSSTPLASFDNNNDVQFNPKDLHKFQNQLEEISAQRVQGNFVDENGNVLKGSEKISTLLDRCLRYTTLVLERLVMPAITGDLGRTD